MRCSAMLYGLLYGQPHCTAVVAQRNLYILLLLYCAVEGTFTLQYTVVRIHSSYQYYLQHM